MPEHKPSAPAQTDVLRKLGYETEDVNPAGLVKWLAYLFIFLALMSVISLGIYWLFVPTPLQTTPETALRVQSMILPPEPFPLLQQNPRYEIKDFRRYEDGQLQSYGWVDKKKGVIRIPVDDAIDLTAKEGLPARAGAQSAPTDQSAYSGFSIPTTVMNESTSTSYEESRPTTPEAAVEEPAPQPAGRPAPANVAPTPRPIAPAPTAPVANPPATVPSPRTTPEPGIAPNPLTPPAPNAAGVKPAPHAGANAPGKSAAPTKGPANIPPPPLPPGANPAGPFGSPGQAPGTGK